MLVVREWAGSRLAQLTIVDPTVIGNIGRYLNHSCRPNCRLVPVRTASLVPHLALFTSRQVAAGEELTFDYGEPGGGGGGEGVLRPGGGAALGRTFCRCGAAECRGHLPYDAELL